MIRALLCIATTLAIALATIGSTGANFTAVQQNTGNSYNAKTDWIAPTVSLADPGANLRATVPLAATANDSGSGVATVVIERSPAGAGTWTQVCSTSVSPYSCNLDTAAGATPDGFYDFRARATDAGGNSATSATVANRRIDNTGPAGVTMADPGTPIAGTKAFTGTATDTGGSGVASVKFQYRPSAGGAWVDGCTSTVSPYGCSLNTSTLTDGLYDFQALATDVAGNTTASAIFTSKRIDNGLPSVSMPDPGAGPFSGSKGFTATASDGGSGVAGVKFQYRPSSGGLWINACDDPSSPYSCTLDTTTLTDGLYDFQALVTDNAGNTNTSALYTSRRVDNVAPTVTMNDPGPFLKTGSALSASATDGGGIASVVIQRRTNGGSTWTTVCTINASPYTCALPVVADGVYDFQAIATDNGNRQTTSAVVLSRRIDNTVPSPVGITNPGASISGTKTLTGTATDGGSGLETVALQYSPTGQNNWTTACSGTASPTNCSWDSTTVSDGVYDFRTLATDRSGNQAASATASPNSRVDNFAPTVTMDDPGQYIRGTVTASATAADGGGILNVAIQYRPAGGPTWTTICTPTVAPYSCSVNSTGAADGLYDFRAVATDNASKVTTSAIIANRRVDNTAPTGVTITAPASPIKGTVSFSGAASDGTGSGIATVEFQYLSGGTWTTACTATVSPYTCNSDTTTIPDGSYTWRAWATDAAGGSTASASTTARIVDNNGPSVTMNDPGAWIGGTETLTASASDPGTGVGSVKIQYKTSGGSTWADVCTDNVTPYTCTLDTTTLVNGGGYDFRAIATDGASFSTTSAVVANRTVDNTLPTITFAGPGSPISGSVALASTPADVGSGVASVLYEYKLSSSATWTTACTGSSSPWGCSWASTGVTEGSYDLRATVTDAAGNQTVSTAVTGRIVDNDTTPNAVDVQAPNTGTAGKMEVNDSIIFTFSEPVAPGSILSGWTGSSAATVVVQVDNVTTAGLDRLSVWDSAGTTLTGLTSAPTAGGLRLFQNYTGGQVKFNGSMTMSGSTVTIVFTSLRSGSVNGAAANTGTMQWAPTAALTDLAGHPLATTTITESGAVDKDF